MRALVLIAVLSGLPVLAQAKASPGFVEMQIRDVVAVQDGASYSVVLSPRAVDDPAADVLLPIFIGEAEGNAIRMRLNHQTAVRPMTHDLLETMIRTLGGKVLKIEIDDLKDNTYLGKIHLAQGEKVMEIDARPSDSIALALGTGAPIFAARKVIDAAGVSKRQLERKDKRPTRRTGETRREGETL
jgi:uncharacterized protein